MQLKRPSAAAVTAFTASVEQLTSGEGRLLLAVSGGPDSLALLLLAHAAQPDRIEAATMDHGLRNEAADEAIFVGNVCGSLGIQHHILHPAQPIAGSLQAEARRERYAALHTRAITSGCDWIATAHHADDQLETILMRIARGSGIDGLAAVRARHGRVIRPLLHFRKAELEGICAECRVTPIFDPSNLDLHFDRVAVRQWLANSRHPLEAHRAVQTANACADASEALNWVTEQYYHTHVQLSANDVTLETSNLPRELLRRLTLRIIDTLQPGYTPRGEALDEAMHALAKGEQRMLGDIICQGGTNWRFRPAPKRRHS